MWDQSEWKWAKVASTTRKLRWMENRGLKFFFVVYGIQKKSIVDKKFSQTIVVDGTRLVKIKSMMSLITIKVNGGAL